MARTRGTPRLQRWLIRHQRSLLVTSCIAAAIIFAVGRWILYSPDRIADRLVTRMDSADVTELPGLTTELASLGDPGISGLVELLGSERADVRQATRQMLREEFARWRHLEPYEATRRVSYLATLLDQQLLALKASEREFAANLATEIMLWPLQGDSRDRMEVVEVCERVLRHSLESHDAIEREAQTEEEVAELLANIESRREDFLIERSQALAANPPGAFLADQPQRLPVAESEALASNQDEASLLVPRLDLDEIVDNSPSLSPMPIEGAADGGASLQAPTFETRPWEAISRFSNDQPGTPSPLYSSSAIESGAGLIPIEQGLGVNNDIEQGGNEMDADNGMPGNSVQGQFASNPSESLPATDSVESHEPPNRFPGHDHAAMDRRTEPQINNQRPDRLYADLRRRSHIDLMIKLQSSDPELIEMASRELRMRGFTDEQLDISRLVTSEQVSIRLEAVQQLGGGTSYDPRPWLRWLCNDPDVEVRARAMMIIATSPHRDDQRLVKELLRMEENASIRPAFSYR